jgi:hypothetical protein
MEKKLDFTAAWNDALALLKGNLEVVLPVAGVFLLLPIIIFGFVAPQPDFAAGGNQDVVMNQMREWLGVFLPGIIVLSLISIIGNLAIYSLVLKPEKPSVGQAITMALGMFLPMLLAAILSGIATFVGFIFLIVPGIYLAIKFSLTGPALVAEGIRSPIDALKRSWELTKGNSLYIFAFFLIIGIVGLIVMGVSSAIFTAIFTMVLPDSASLLVSAIISGILQTIFNIVILFIGIAIYRQLSASN